MMTVMRRRKRARKARRMLIMLQTILQLLPLLLLLLKRKNLSLLRRSWKLNKVSHVILKAKWKIESFVKYSVLSIFGLHHIMFTGIDFSFSHSFLLIVEYKIFIGCSVKTDTITKWHWIVCHGTWFFWVVFFFTNLG